MIQVYIMSVEALAKGTIFAGAFQKVEEGRRTKVQRAKRQGDKIRSLGAGLLLQYALACHLKGAGEAGERGTAQNVDEDSFDRNETETVFLNVDFYKVYEAVKQPLQFTCRYGPEGKPYLQEYPHFFFSLSHSGAYAVCAAAGREVGADIQVEREEKDYSRAKRYFTGGEAGLLEHALLEQQKQLFYRIWTAKEAYVKLTGKGLKQGLNSFHVDLEQGSIKEEAAPEKEGKAGLTEYDGLSGYAVCVCFYRQFT